MALAATTGKLVAVVTNVVFLAVGLFLVIVGSIVIDQANNNLINGANVLQFFPAKSIGAAFLVLGLLLLFITAVGIVGVLRKNKRLLAVYLPIVFIIVMAQAILTIILVVFSRNADQLMDATMKDYWINNPEADVKFQNSFKCCGYTGKDDAPNQACPADTTTFADGSQLTCKQAAITWVTENVKPVVVAVAFVVSLELMAWLSVCYVRSNVKDNEFEDKWVH